MRKLVPIINSVVCKKITEDEELTMFNFLHLKKKNVDLYKILSFCSDDEEFNRTFKIGDIIMSASTGDEIEVNDGDVIFLFKTEHIMCKVDE